MAVNPPSPSDYLPGFSEAAAFIGSATDLAIFRRFDTLSARNLLYLQAYLCSLESKLNEYDSLDNDVTKHGSISDKMSVLQAARDWDSFVQRAETDEKQKVKMNLVLDIRRVMKEYPASIEEAMVLHSQVLNMKSPNSQILNILKSWFSDRKPFVGHEGDLMHCHNDLAALKPALDQDHFSRGIRNCVGFMFKERRAIPASWGDIYYFPERGVGKVVSIASVLLSTLMLFGAIASLNYVPATNQSFRLGVIGAFTLVFAIIVTFFTSASRSELFGAVSAYSAVLVVFSAVGVSVKQSH